MREKICGLYYIENLKDGKKYVGQSIDILKEWKNKHLNNLRKNKHHNSYLQNAYNKYGEENFVHTIIEKCEKEELNDKECYYILKYESHFSENGYNISWGGNNSKIGMKHTEQTKQKMSKSRKGKSPSQEWRDNLSMSLMGHIISNDTKEKISKTLMGKFSGKESPVLGRKSSTASSKYFGIYKNKEVYTINIRVSNVSIYVGRNKDEIIAAKMYDKYIVQNNLPNPLNFPEDRDKYILRSINNERRT